MNLLEVEDLKAAEALIDLNGQFRVARVLLAAHQLGVPEALREAKTAAQVAAQCGTDAGMTEKLLIACCALGITRRQDDRFALTQLGRELLLPESLRYAGGATNHHNSLWWFWTGLTDVVREGRREAAPKPPEAVAAAWHENWIRAMHGISANGTAQWLARQLDLRGRRFLLDVGGGPGTYSIILCQRFPGLRAVIWDLPQTIAIAEPLIQRFGLEDRITVRAGDWNQNDFPEGYDCLLMSNVLHGPGSQAAMKLGKALRALPPGGLFIAHEFLLNNDRSGPLAAALFNLMVGAYTVDEILVEIRVAGFAGASLIAQDPEHGRGLVTATRP